MLNVQLKVLTGKLAGKLLPLQTKRILVGREPDCHMRLNNDSVSRNHCVFQIDDFTIRVRDLNSTNGTFVNDRQIDTEVQLHHGDKLGIGLFDFEIHIEQPPDVLPELPPATAFDDMLPPII